MIKIKKNNQINSIIIKVKNLKKWSKVQNQKISINFNKIIAMIIYKIKILMILMIILNHLPRFYNGKMPFYYKVYQIYINKYYIKQQIIVN